MRVTQKKLAEILGVDRSTISKALAGHPAISETMKHKVRSLCDEMHYVPDYHGRNLSTGRTGVISITRGYLALDEFSASRIWYLQQAAEAHGLRIRLDSFDDSLKSVRENSCDGVVVLQPPSLSGTLGQVYRNLEAPVVFTDCSMGDGASFCVCLDWADGMQKSVEHLISLGHEYICFTGSIQNSVGCHDRYHGYVDSMSTHCLETNLKTAITFADWPGDVREIEQYAPEIKGALKDGYTAFCCSSDLIAAGVIRSLMKAGIRVPQDVSVTGYDDSSIAQVIYPSLTSVNQNFQEIAAQTFNLMTDLLNPSVDRESINLRRSVKGSLTIRESTGPQKTSPSS